MCVSIGPVYRDDLLQCRQGVWNKQYGHYLREHMEFHPLWNGSIHRLNLEQSLIPVHLMGTRHHCKTGHCYTLLAELKESEHIHPLCPVGLPSSQLPAAPCCAA